MSHRRATAPTRRRYCRDLRKAWWLDQPLALALLLPLLQARAATSAPAPPPAPFDPWALATSWLKPQGAIGLFALGGLAIACYALSQAQNWEALLRLLGKG